VRGGICNIGGHLVTCYAWGLGTMSNNELEACTLFEGIRLKKSMGIRKLTIVGDSMMVIGKWLKTTSLRVMFVLV
jgi:ribonuclease HI